MVLLYIFGSRKKRQSFSFLLQPTIEYMKQKKRERTILIETYAHNKDNATICGALYNCGPKMKVIEMHVLQIIFNRDYKFDLIVLLIYKISFFIIIIILIF